MKIMRDSFGFFVEENGQKIAHVQFVQNTMVIDFKEFLKESKKQEIRSLCDQQKNKLYRIVSRKTEEGDILGFLYLSGYYQKVAMFEYGKLTVLQEFNHHITEIEQYVNEHFKENFIVCQ